MHILFITKAETTKWEARTAKERHILFNQGFFGFFIFINYVFSFE